MGLPTEHDLRKSLTMKPACSMCQLMNHIDEHKRVKEDQTRGKAKTKIFFEKRDPRVGGYNHNRHGRDFSNQSPRISAQIVNSMFKELAYQILKKIKKNKPYFKWPNKMGGDLSKQIQSLYYHYHQERGHKIEDCRTLRDHWGQLVKAGKLKQFLHQSIE